MHDTERQQLQIGDRVVVAWASSRFNGLRGTVVRAAPGVDGMIVRLDRSHSHYGGQTQPFGLQALRKIDPAVRPFQVGDRVRVSGNQNSSVKAGVGTIIDTRQLWHSNLRNVVQFEGMSGGLCYADSELELLEPVSQESAVPTNLDHAADAAAYAAGRAFGKTATSAAASGLAIHGDPRIALGDVVKDQHSPFTGTVIALTEYLYDEPQALVASEELSQGRTVQEWFSVDRLTKVDEGPF